MPIVKYMGLEFVGTPVDIKHSQIITYSFKLQETLLDNETGILSRTPEDPLIISSLPASPLHIPSEYREAYILMDGHHRIIEQAKTGINISKGMIIGIPQEVKEKLLSEPACAGHIVDIKTFIRNNSYRIFGDNIIQQDRYVRTDN